MAHGDNGSTANSVGLWRPGTLSIDDLERLAGEIRPSWEIGLDVAARGESPMAPLPSDVATPSANGFAAAPGKLANQVAALAAVRFRSDPPPGMPGMKAAAATASADGTAQLPASRSTNPPRPQHKVVFADADEPVSLPQIKSRTPLYAAIGGVVLIAGIVFFALRGGSSPTSAAPPASLSTSAPASVATSPAANPAPAIAPTPAAPAPTPAPTPTPAIEPTPAAPPVAAAPTEPAPPAAPAPAAPEPAVEPTPAPAAPAHVAEAPPTPAAPAHVAAPSRPAAPVRPAHVERPAPSHSVSHSRPSRPSGRRPGGAGFVTESPY